MLNVQEIIGKERDRERENERMREIFHFAFGLKNVSSTTPWMDSKDMKMMPCPGNTRPRRGMRPEEEGGRVF